MVPSVAHLLNRTLAVWRPAVSDDGSGGQDVTLSHVGDVRAKVDQPTAEERQVADQLRAEHTHTIRFLPDADVQRGDELRGDGQTFHVLATLTPSHPVYRRGLAQLIQSEPGQVDS